VLLAGVDLVFVVVAVQLGTAADRGLKKITAASVVA
jgi:hypothetical protein